MFLIKVENVKMELMVETLFEDVSLEVKEKERVALLGRNGVGKSTLLKGIFGKTPIADGNIQFKIKQNEIGWMMQDSDIGVDLTTREWVENAHKKNSRLKKELNEYAGKLAIQSDDEKLADLYQQTLQKYLDSNGYEWELEVERTLNRFGIPVEVWDIPFGNLSGGQKTRAKLAKVMNHSPKLLVLDEPTNHLDIDTVEWLQEWLNRYKGSVLFISHERDFIDKVATVTYELTEKGTMKYEGGYSEYKAQKELEIKTIHALYEKQEHERKKLMETIQTYKNWYQKANANASVRNPFAQKQASKQADKYKAKEKALERLERNRVEKPEEAKTIHTDFHANGFSGRRMIDLRNVDFSYGSHPMLHEVNIQVNRGDRIALVGKNGSGKTTLLKLMTGELAPIKGEITWNPQLKIGYFFQELEHLSPENSVLEELLSLPNMTQSEARTILACFLFRKEEVFKTVRHLSMGEKCRVAFVKLYFSNANLLILDEPTNYLDIETRERIEEALATYPGSVVVVAHDPYLLRKVANKVVTIQDKGVSHYPGSFKEWEQHSNIPSKIQAIKNQQQLLELELVELVSEETEDTVQEEKSRFIKIKEIKQRLEYLKRITIKD